MSAVLLVSRDKATTNSLATEMRDYGYQLYVAPEAQAGVNWARSESFIAAVVDIRNDNIDPVDVVRILRSSDSGIGVVFIVETASEGLVSDLRRLPGTDLVASPVNPNELALRIHRLAESRKLVLEADSLRGERDLIFRTEDIVGLSPQMQEVLRLVDRTAPMSTNVLLMGETGTGKELLAGAIHYSSPRRHRAFVKVNCAAVPETLLESELFGYEKGAFTGATRQRTGRFEQADGGSILLDEIGEISPSVQTKLLRAVQNKEFERVGGDRTVHVDTRIIAATNRDLFGDVRSGRFREDLYYRLAVIVIHVPPLRERVADILPLARHLLEKACNDAGKPLLDLSEESERFLSEYSWPGNIRELQNAIERAVIMADTPVLQLDDFAMSERARGMRPVASHDHLMTLDATERQAIEAALTETGWVQKDAASILGLSPRALNYRLKKHGLTHPSWRTNKPDSE